MPRVYIEASETVDAGNAAQKAKRIDFGSAIAAALVKKKVPVTTVQNDFQSAAEAFAKHFNDDYLKKSKKP